MTRVEFSVAGDPVPQGSTRAFARNGRVVTTNDPSGRLERWRGDIRQAFIVAAAAVDATTAPLDGPLEAAAGICVEFAFRRPKSHYLPVTKSRPEPLLRANAPVWHTAKPDVDRCLRAVLDALTLVAYRDDDQVVIVRGDKRWSSTPGARIVVFEVVE